MPTSIYCEKAEQQDPLRQRILASVGFLWRHSVPVRLTQVRATPLFTISAQGDSMHCNMIQVKVEAFVIPLKPKSSHSLKSRFSNIWRTTENPSFRYESQSVLMEQARILLPKLTLVYHLMLETNCALCTSLFQHDLKTEPFHPFIKYSQHTRRDELGGKR